MRTITAREANQSFSKWLSEAERGEEIVITRHGKRVATLKPYSPPAMTPERQAAIERALAVVRKGLPLGMTRPLTRDEMHER
jgi:prevent-host-death family protein